MQVTPHYLLTQYYWKALVLKVGSKDPCGGYRDFQGAPGSMKNDVVSLESSLIQF